MFSNFKNFVTKGVNEGIEIFRLSQVTVEALIQGGKDTQSNIRI